MSLSLLRTRRFGPFFVTQFLGAFNDNAFKNALFILITFQAAAQAGWTSTTLVNVGQALFIAPFLMFSAAAGYLADRVEKAGLIRRIKLCEVAIMGLAAAAFLLNSTWLLLFVLFLMGTQSAFFGPVKYAILPQHLEEHELVAGNGVVEMGTFLAILLGTVAGGVLIAWEGLGSSAVAGALVVIAVLGYLASRGIPNAPPEPGPPAPAPRFGTGVYHIIRHTAANRTVFNSILGISWFWLYGAMILTQLPALTRDYLAGDELVGTLLLTVFSLGIGVGSLLCERMSGRLVEIGLVPFGSIGLTVFALDLAFAIPDPVPGAALAGAGEFVTDHTNWRLLFDLFAIALFGGFFIVPLYALVQLRSPPEVRSRIIAGNNVLNALFIIAASAIALALLSAGLSIPQLIVVLALMTAAVSIYIFTLVPEFLMRFIVWMLIHTVYRLRSTGLDAIPDGGPAVLAVNHVSFVDALIIAAACRRPVRFVMYHKIFQLPVVNFVFRVSRAIPIAPRSENPQMMDDAFDAIAHALSDGEVVCIFPEGQITGSGDMNPFRPGIERIIERTPVPVVPFALRGLWGSFFSRKGGAAMTRPWRLLANLRGRVELAGGAPIAPEQFDLAELECVVASLRGDWR
ncbi:MAG: MFS transporter [Pseudomonadota bacterium]